MGASAVRCQPQHPLPQGWHLSPSCPGHTIPSLTSLGQRPQSQCPQGRGRAVTSPQPEHPSLFCSPKGCRKSQWIYRQTGVPGEYYCRGE